MSRSILGLSVIGLLGLGGCSSESDTSAPPGSSTGASSNTGGEASSNGGSANTGGSATGAGGSTASGAATGSGGAAAGNGGSSTGNGGSSTGNGGNTTATGGSTGSGGSTTGTPTYDEVKGWIDAYHTAHPGKDGDVVMKTPAQLAADPDAQRLRSLCGPDQLPIIPALAWEYGGNDHAWINPDQSPLVICVYIAVNPSTDHWKYDAGADHITADAYVLFPAQNPCNGRTGADQVLGCIGDQTNLEILVDTSSINDGADVGLQLANASTDIYLILGDGSKVLLYQNV
jgi:hypothetical protein